MAATFGSGPVNYHASPIPSTPNYSGAKFPLGTREGVATWKHPAPTPPRRDGLYTGGRGEGWPVSRRIQKTTIL